jgi:ribonuclease HII
MPMAKTRQTDTLTWERQLWEGGYRLIAGVDEVGRGALAGPLVAAAVILPSIFIELVAIEPGWLDVRDSKTISHRKRSELAAWIHASGATVSIASVSCDELDAIGTAAANRCAMERAVTGLAAEPDMLLIDAMTIDLDTPQIGIIDGDAQSLSIAAASIVAKVHRDSLMVELDSAYPAYGFARHKGYGVAHHLAALTERGPCPMHRRSFAPVRLAAGLHGFD